MAQENEYISKESKTEIPVEKTSAKKDKKGVSINNP